MYYINEFGIYVNKVEDLRGKVSEELYEVIEKLMNKNEIEKLMNKNEINEENNILKDELHSYEMSMEELRFSMNEIENISDKIEDDIFKLMDYLSNAKRIDRREIESKLCLILRDVKKIQNKSTDY